MRTGGVTKIILCAEHFYNKIIACFCAILRIYAPSLEGSKDAFRHELIVFQTSKLAEKAPIQRASCLGSRQDSDCTKNSHFQKMHEPLAGFCRPSIGKFLLKGEMSATDPSGEPQNLEFQKKIKKYFMCFPSFVFLPFDINSGQKNLRRMGELRD